MEYLEHSRGTLVALSGLLGGLPRGIKGYTPETQWGVKRRQGPYILPGHSRGTRAIFVRHYGGTVGNQRRS